MERARGLGLTEEQQLVVESGIVDLNVPQIIGLLGEPPYRTLREQLEASKCLDKSSAEGTPQAFQPLPGGSDASRRTVAVHSEYQILQEAFQAENRVRCEVLSRVPCGDVRVVAATSAPEHGPGPYGSRCTRSGRCRKRNALLCRSTSVSLVHHCCLAWQQSPTTTQAPSATPERRSGPQTADKQTRVDSLADTLWNLIKPLCPGVSPVSTVVEHRALVEADGL